MLPAMAIMSAGSWEPQLPHGGPHLAVAVLCADGGFDASGHLRIETVITRAAIQEPRPDEGIDVWLTATIVVAFRSGQTTGPARIGVKVSNEDGLVTGTAHWDVTFDHPEQVVGIAGPVTIVVSGLGLYWWDVSLDDVPVTRIPLRMVAAAPTERTAAGPPVGTRLS
jgi:hypothetical protein